MSSLKIIGGENLIHLAQVSNGPTRVANESVMRIKKPVSTGVASNASTISSIPPRSLQPKDLSKPVSAVHALPEWLSIASTSKNRAVLTATDPSAASSMHALPPSTISEEHHSKLSEGMSVLMSFPKTAPLLEAMTKNPNKREVQITAADPSYTGPYNSIVLNSQAGDYRSKLYLALNTKYLDRVSAPEVAAVVYDKLQKISFETDVDSDPPALKTGGRSIYFGHELQAHQNQDELYRFLNIDLDVNAQNYAIDVRQEMLRSGEWNKVSKAKDKKVGKEAFIDYVGQISPELLPWFKEFKLGNKVYTVGEVIDALEQFRGEGYEGYEDQARNHEVHTSMEKIASAVRSGQISMDDVFRELERPYRFSSLGRETIRQELPDYLTKRH